MVSQIRMVVLKAYKPTRQPFKVIYGPTVFSRRKKCGISGRTPRSFEELGDSLLGRIADVTRVQFDIYVSVHERQTKDQRMLFAKKEHVW